MNIKLAFGIGLSLFLHFLLLYILGTIIISHYGEQTEEYFVAIPISKSIKPPKKEYKITLNKKKKNTTSIRPQPMTFKNPANIEVPYSIKHAPLNSSKSHI